MSKEEFLKIQTCVLKVNIHCDGCKQKVKKILQKIDGVYTIKIDSEQGKVTVSGSVDAATLVKKLTKKGKYAEVWGASAKAQNNAQNNQNLLKNFQVASAKAGSDKKGGIALPKGGVQNQIQLMKGLQDLKMMPLSKVQNQKSGKFSKPEDEDLSDDDYDDDDEDYDDEDYDDEDEDYESDEDDLEDVRSQVKPTVGKGPGGPFMPNLNLLMNGKLPVNASGGHGGNGGVNPKKGGAQVNGGGGKVGVNGGKNGANGNSNNGGNQTQGAGKGGGGGGGQTNKNGNHGGGGVANGNNLMADMAKKVSGMNAGANGMPYMMPMGQMDNLAAVQGLPALSTAPGGGGGYLNGARSDHLAGNPYHQQQLAAMMMNQQRATTGKESFQPMMYARPPPAVNYVPPFPTYPYPPPPGEYIHQYNIFDDENTSSCSLM